VLEIFGEHSLTVVDMSALLALSALLLAGYALHARGRPMPLLQLPLFAIRSFRVAVSGSFFTRLGIRGVPFLLPLLYQVGLGFTPIQSGLLIMPQAAAAMTMKLVMPPLLARVGYRGVLVSNTLVLGLLLMAFSTIGPGTPVWLILLQAFFFGAFTSLQYTSMNTLVYADVVDRDTSAASCIASTAQQMSISFGVAVAGLATALLVHATDSDAPGMIAGIHKALVALGGLTLVSTLLFTRLHADDGDGVSQHHVLNPGG
jgi:Na+/melibiose symporter-like transporter